jgi:putative PEP-CTERM system TPR-repeat lipoprotein
MLRARPSPWWRCALSVGAIAAFLNATASAGEGSSYLRAAQEYLKKGDLKSALIELRSAAQQAPQDPKIRAELATTYLRLGDAGSALREARAARERKGDEADYLPVLAQALLRLGKFADLLGQVEPDARAPALESKVRLAIGLADAGLNRNDKAEAALRDAVRLDPDSALAKIGLGRFLIAKNPAEAGKLVDQVLARDPHLAGALEVKGLILQIQGDRDGALRRFDEVLKIDPDNASARLNRAALYIDEGKFGAADGDLDPVLRASPDNAQANFLRAAELFRQNKYAEADAILTRISPAFDTIVKGYYLQGAVKFQLGRYAQSENLAAKYIAHVPNDADAVRLAALAALRQQTPARAIAYLQPLAGKTPADAKTLSLLGDAYMADGKPELALQQYQRAAALEPGNPKLDTAIAVSEIGAGQGKAGISELQRLFKTKAGAAVAGPTLVLTELRAGRPDQAAAVAGELVKRDPKNPLYQTLLGSARFEQRDYAAAETAFRAAATLQQGFGPATANLAKLYLATARAGEAAKVYQGLLAKQPDDVTALLGLAQVAVVEQHWDEAEHYLDRARTAAAGEPGPGIALVNFYFLRREPGRALALAGQLGDQFPTNPDVLDARGRAQAAAGDKSGAIATYKRAYELAPNSAPILSRYLGLLTSAKNFAAARTLLQQAVDRNPRNASLKADLIRVEAEADGLAAGLAKARGFAKDDSDNPNYDIVAAELYEKAGKSADAQALLERAAAARPSQDELTLALSALYNRTGEPGKAEAILKSRLANNPQDTALQTALGLLYLNRKNYPTAMTAFQQLAAERPKDAAVLNNLAWLYRQQGDLAKAGQSAERALALAPGNGSIQDTLGWILLAQGETGRAVSYLTAANQAAPTDPIIQYHLAVALDRAGRSADARAILEKLLASGAAFDDKTAAEKLLKQLKNS